MDFCCSCKSALEKPTKNKPGRSRERQPLIAGPGDIQPDILMVNNSVLTVAEVLYPLRKEIEKARAEQTPEGLRDVEDALHPLSEISDQR